MTHFRGTIQSGNRKEVSRLGHARAGLTATVNGWTAGVRVEAHVDPATGLDTFHVYLTRGSNQLGLAREEVAIGIIEATTDEKRDDVHGPLFISCAGEHAGHFHLVDERKRREEYRKALAARARNRQTA